MTTSFSTAPGKKNGNAPSAIWALIRRRFLTAPAMLERHLLFGWSGWKGASDEGSLLSPKKKGRHWRPQGQQQESEILILSFFLLLFGFLFF
jgi:hypothetical protein